MSIGFDFERCDSWGAFVSPTKPPQVLLDRYAKVSRDCIGRGGNAEVHLYCDTYTKERFKEPVAVKFLKRWTSDEASRVDFPKRREAVLQELLIHRRLQHPLIVRYHELVTLPYCLDLTMGIVMEYVPGGDFIKELNKHKQLDESRARWFFQQIVLAVDYLHKMGIAHRDLKFENILVYRKDKHTKPVIKICDFGQARDVIDRSPASTVVGTPDYMAPEVSLTPKYYQYAAMKVDIWACGVMLYMMVTGQDFAYALAEGHGEPVEILEASADLVNYKDPDCSLSPDCRDLIRRMLTVPARRATIEEIKNHAWVRTDCPHGFATFNEELMAEQQIDPPSSEMTEEQLRSVMPILCQPKPSVPDPQILSQHAQNSPQSYNNPWNTKAGVANATASQSHTNSAVGRGGNIWSTGKFYG